jgi:ubiquinone/menaquinone biosynthesis C-methylase UbiE
MAGGGVTGKPANFSGRAFVNKAPGFDSPTMLPKDDVQRAAWQEANKSWWESTPMRYDWREAVASEPGSRAYFEEIDRRFLGLAKKYTPWFERPFEQLIPYADLPNMDVLEIGVGHGTHAQLIASRCRSFTGIDLTGAACKAVVSRFQIFGLQGRIAEMDAEELSFPDASFDYIWSWGVIHHSADTSRILRQMHRVLRPGGRATVMVYHRNWWNFLIVAGLLKGIVQGQLGELGKLHHVAQGATDGAIARCYTPKEWRDLASGLFDVERVRIFGLKSEVILLPPGGFKRALERAVPDAMARFATNTMKLGSFLVADMRRV